MPQSASEKQYRVRAVQCDWRAADEEIYQALKRATAPLTRAWERLAKARTIAIKFNQDKERKNLVLFNGIEGIRQQLVSDSVARATLRLLRERTTAHLMCVDVSFYRVYSGTDENTTQLRNILKEFDVEYVDCNVDPIRYYPVPGGGLMFDKYPMAQRVVEADERVSVQKMKNHAFMGITLCMKNLFGLMPTQPAGRPRTYYHHLVRMPYMLADLGRLFNPALNIIDGLACQAGEEWGKGQFPRTPNTLVAGDHVVATDACTAHLMGHDPQSDWGVEPFHRDRNALRIAAESGFGTVDLNQIDFESEVAAPVGEFHSIITDPRDIVVSWRRTTAEQGLRYLDLKKSIIDRYRGEYILLQQGEVRWHDKDGVVKASRRILSGANPEQAMWMKWVDPDEGEGENYGVYERTLQQMAGVQ